MVWELDYEKHSDFFHKRYGMTFGDSAVSNSWRIAGAYIRQLTGGDCGWFRATTLSPGEGKCLPDRRKRPSLAGQGILTVQTFSTRHCVAYASGMIYDPRGSRTETWEEFAQALPYHKVDGQERRVY